MNPDYNKRNFLLPAGCKDLIDTLYINVPEETTVAQLAELLHQQPPKLIADLFQTGVFASVHQKLNFETTSKLAQKYGYIAKRKAS